ncbi:MAG TPA: hypothetical protein PLQ49_05545 [Methanothrix sp.]|nr:hypothetical protein [Methanothrix sp.]
MYGKELATVVGLLVLTALPIAIGIKNKFDQEVSLIQMHLVLLTLMYLVLFHIGSILSYQTYSKYKQPSFLWSFYYNIVKSRKRRREIDRTLNGGVIGLYQSKLIDLTFDDIKSNDNAKKELGLVSIKEIFSDPRISLELRKKIISDLITSIEHEQISDYKNKLIIALLSLTNEEILDSYQ